MPTKLDPREVAERIPCLSGFAYERRPCNDGDQFVHGVPCGNCQLLTYYRAGMKAALEWALREANCDIATAKFSQRKHMTPELEDAVRQALRGLGVGDAD